MNKNMLAFPTPFTVTIQYDDGSWMRTKVFAMRDLGYNMQFFIYSILSREWLWIDSKKCELENAGELL